MFRLFITSRNPGCVRKRRSVRSDRSDRRKTRSVNGRNVGGVWSDRTHSVRKCVSSVGHFDRSPNTDRSIYISIDVNKRSRRCHADLEKSLQQLQTPSSQACSRRSEMRRTIRSIRHDFPNARPVPNRSIPIGLTALSEHTHSWVSSSQSTQSIYRSDVTACVGCWTVEEQLRITIASNNCKCTKPTIET
jgi:hypothetical protein